LVVYYLWLNDAQAGPFTLHQVQSMWNDGQITGLTLFWQEGNEDWVPLNTIQSTIEPVRPADLEKTAIVPTVKQVFVKRVHDHVVAQAAATPASPESHVETVEWTGFPTWWNWSALLAVAVVLCLLPIGFITFALLPIFISLITVPIAGLIVLYIYFARRTTKYTITNKRVSLENGIFTKSSRELRIQDIRSIAAHINFLGYGNLEFSSASDEVDVTFTAVSGAAKVRDLVKKLQA
jgi:membrane protein YdbS with pleckstrin-like domain